MGRKRGSDLVMDLLYVFRVTDNNVLVDELRPEDAALRGALAPLRAPALRGALAPRRAPAPAHRQRALVFLEDPTSSLRRAKISLHGIWSGSTRVCSNYEIVTILSVFSMNNI